MCSGAVTKINRKGKKQGRGLLVTNRALYNVMPRKYGSVKRRIPLAFVEAVSVSRASDEFVIHVPIQYDYHMASPDRNDLLKGIMAAHGVATGGRLPIIEVEAADLRAVCITKDKKKQGQKVGLLACISLAVSTSYPTLVVVPLSYVPTTSSSSCQLQVTNCAATSLSV